MDNNELKIGPWDYRFGKLHVMQQFHVARRLGPALIVAGISVEMISKGIENATSDLVAMAGPVIQVISQMPDSETDYVIFTCLSVVSRKQGTTFAPLVARDGKTLMFEDLDMPTMIRLVIEVLRANLQNFLPGLIGEMQSQENSAAGQPPLSPQ